MLGLEGLNQGTYRSKRIRFAKGAHVINIIYDYFGARVRGVPYLTLNPKPFLTEGVLEAPRVAPGEDAAPPGAWSEGPRVDKSCLEAGLSRDLGFRA